jgi:hypothetical protein
MLSLDRPPLPTSAKRRHGEMAEDERAAGPSKQPRTYLYDAPSTGAALGGSPTRKASPPPIHAAPHNPPSSPVYSHKSPQARRGSR